MPARLVSPNTRPPDWKPPAATTMLNSSADHFVRTVHKRTTASGRNNTARKVLRQHNTTKAICTTRAKGRTGVQISAQNSPYNSTNCNGATMFGPNVSVLSANGAATVQNAATTRRNGRASTFPLATYTMTAMAALNNAAPPDSTAGPQVTG